MILIWTVLILIHKILFTLYMLSLAAWKYICTEFVSCRCNSVLLKVTCDLLLINLFIKYQIHYQCFLYNMWAAGLFSNKPKGIIFYSECKFAVWNIRMWHITDSVPLNNGNEHLSNELSSWDLLKKEHWLLHNKCILIHGQITLMSNFSELF